MGELFKTLKQYRDVRFINKSSELDYFYKNRFLLKLNQMGIKLYDSSDLFDIIKANVIIKSLKNKDDIEQIVHEELINHGNLADINVKENIYEKLLDLPCIIFNTYKVYVPFFNQPTNIVFSVDFEKMQEEPYVSIDKNSVPFTVNPFETYNVSLFDSTFTELIRIDEDLTSVAFYDYSFNTLFFINKQGSLDAAVYLFDKHMKHPSRSNVVDRLRPVVSAYYDNRLNDFVNLLFSNDLISYKLYRKICKVKKL
jgi:hypothetical protein